MNETHDVDLLNEGLQGEYFAITAYDAALGTGLLSATVTTVAKGFQADHRAHSQAIREAIERLRGRRGESPKHVYGFGGIVSATDGGERNRSLAVRGITGAWRGGRRHEISRQTP